MRLFPSKPAKLSLFFKSNSRNTRIAGATHFYITSMFDYFTENRQNLPFFPRLLAKHGMLSRLICETPDIYLLLFIFLREGGDFFFFFFRKYAIFSRKIGKTRAELHKTDDFDKTRAIFRDWLSKCGIFTR